jgi:hypothetical protein
MSAAPEDDDDNGAADCFTLTVDTHPADLFKWLEKISTAGHFCQSPSEDGTLVPNIECRPEGGEPFLCNDLHVRFVTVIYQTFGRFVLFLGSNANRVIIYRQEGASFTFEYGEYPDAINQKIRVDEHLGGILQKARHSPTAFYLGEVLRKFQDPDTLFYYTPKGGGGTPIPPRVRLVPLSAGHNFKSAVKA